MEKISKDSLNVGTYEQYTKYYKSRGVGIISDKQFAFYTQVNLNDYLNHDTAIANLDKMIYPNKTYNGFYEKTFDIAIASVKETVIIDLPESCSMSDNQYEMLKYYLNEIKDALIDFPKNKIEFTFFSNSSYCFDNVDDALEYVNDYYHNSATKELKYKEIYNEVIIGKSVDEIKKESLLNHNKRINQKVKRVLERKNNTDKVIDNIKKLKLINSIDCKDKYFEYLDSLKKLIAEAEYKEELDGILLSARSILNKNDKLQSIFLMRLEAAVYSKYDVPYYNEPKKGRIV